MALLRCECLSGVPVAELPGVWVLSRAKTTWEYSGPKGKFSKKGEEEGCLTRREAPGQKKVTSDQEGKRGRKGRGKET